MTTVVDKAPWVSSHAKSEVHWASVVAFGLILFFSYQWTPFLFIGFAAFLLITSFHMIWKMLIFIALISIVLAVLPFLAPLAIIVMIVLFIMRISYVIENWRPVVMGLILYGSSIPLFASVQGYYGYGFGLPLFVAILGAILLHVGLSWLYTYGYSTKTALGIMGSVPIVILAFILPFLKLHVPAPDVFIEASPTPGGHLATDPVAYQPEVRAGSLGQVHGESASVVKSYESKPIAFPEKTAITTYDHGLLEQAATTDVFKHSAIMHPVFNGLITDASSTHFMMKEGTVDLHPNFQGGHDYLQNGSKLWTSQLNQFGGQDVFDTNGQKFASSQPNQFGGENVVDAQNRTLITTQQNSLGGLDLYDQHHSKIGYTTTDAKNTTRIYNHQGSQIGNFQSNTMNIEKPII
ncbi:MAG: hypothetical protein WBB47_07595 [Paenisporosarcina sp.]